MTEHDPKSRTHRDASLKPLDSALLTAGFGFPERIVLGAFSAMPGWVRITTYLLAVILLGYSFLVSCEIGGSVDIQRGATYHAYSGAVVSTMHGSLRYSVESNDGTWRILLPSRIPGSYVVDFAEAGSRNVRTRVTICPSDFLPGRTLRIRFNEEASAARFTRMDASCSPPGDMPGEDAGTSGAIGWIPSVIGSAWAQTQQNPIRISSERETSEKVGHAVRDAGLSGDDGRLRYDQTPDEAARTLTRNLDVPVSPSDITTAKSESDLNGVLSRKINQAEADKAPGASVYMYAGDIDLDGNWGRHYFALSAGSAARPFQPGDVVKATARVNKRSDYIRFGFFGWRNADAVGVAREGDAFVVQETKVIGDHLWVKAVPATIQ